MSRRAVVWFVVFCACALPATFASGQSLPPLRSGAVVPEEGGPATVSIGAKGASGASLHMPWPVEYFVDVVVEGGGKVMITLLTDEQYKALSAGRKPTTQQPPLKVIVTGRGSESLKLPKGDYFLAFNNTGTKPIQVTYRTSYVRQ